MNSLLPASKQNRPSSKLSMQGVSIDMLFVQACTLGIVHYPHGNLTKASCHSLQASTVAYCNPALLTARRRPFSAKCSEVGVCQECFN